MSESLDKDVTWAERHGNRFICYARRGKWTVAERVPLEYGENIHYLAGVARRLKRRLNDIENGLIPTQKSNGAKRARLKGWQRNHEPKTSY